MPEIPNVVGGEAVESDWGNQIRDRTLQKYADQTALVASVPFPDAGMTVWLHNPGVLQFYDGAVWVVLATLDDIATAVAAYLPLTGGTLTGNLAMDSQLQVNSPTDNAGIRVKSGSSVGSGGAVQFGGSQGASSFFAAVQGHLRNGSGNSQGRLDFMIRLTTAATDLTRAFYVHEDRSIRSEGGVIISQYQPVPAAGKDLYWFQTRNMLLKDTAGAPSNADGIDGDVALTYTF